MEITTGIIPVQEQENLKNYVDAEVVDVQSLLQSFLSKVSDIQSSYNQIIQILTNLSTNFPQINSNTSTNVGTTTDFKNGINDYLNGTVSQTNYTQYYNLGTVVGYYLKQLQHSISGVTLTVNGTDNSSLFQYASLQGCLSSIQNYLNILINIQLQSTDTFNSTFQLLNSISFEMLSNYTTYRIQVQNSGSTKPQFIFNNVRKVTFNNLTFINSPPVDTKNLSDISNGLFIFNFCDVEFINCTFIDNSSYDTYLVFSSMSNVIFKNCSFNKTAGSNMYIMNSYNNYPSNVYFVGMNISSLPSNIFPLTPNSTTLITQKSF